MRPRVFEKLQCKRKPEKLFQEAPLLLGQEERVGRKRPEGSIAERFRFVSWKGEKTLTSSHSSPA